MTNIGAQHEHQWINASQRNSCKPALAIWRDNQCSSAVRYSQHLRRGLVEATTKLATQHQHTPVSLHLSKHINDMQSFGKTAVHQIEEIGALSSQSPLHRMTNAGTNNRGIYSQTIGRQG